MGVCLHICSGCPAKLRRPDVKDGVSIGRKKEANRSPGCKIVETEDICPRLHIRSSNLARWEIGIDCPNAVITTAWSRIRIVPPGGLRARGVGDVNDYNACSVPRNIRIIAPHRYVMLDIIRIERVGCRGIWRRRWERGEIPELQSLRRAANFIGGNNIVPVLCRPGIVCARTRICYASNQYGIALYPHVNNIYSPSRVNCRPEDGIVSHIAIVDVTLRVRSFEPGCYWIIEVEDDNPVVGSPICAAVEIHITVEYFNRVRCRRVVRSIRVRKRGYQRCRSREIREVYDLCSAAALRDTICIISPRPYFMP